MIHLRVGRFAVAVRAMTRTFSGIMLRISPSSENSPEIDFPTKEINVKVIRKCVEPHKM